MFATPVNNIKFPSFWERCSHSLDEASGEIRVTINVCTQYSPQDWEQWLDNLMAYNGYTPTNKGHFSKYYVGKYK